MVEITDPENTVIIEMEDGNVTIELLPDVAPKHVKRMKDLARSGHYDNVAFHRVVAGFMAQTGDVQNGVMDDSLNLQMAGTGGSSLPNIPAEFSDLVHNRGTVAAARSQNLNSANSQFFINYSENHFLNGQYTIFGRVVSGMEHIDSLEPGEPPNSPGRMISVRVLSDQNLPARNPKNQTKNPNKNKVFSKPSNNASQSDKLLTDNPLFTLSQYMRVALWIYFIEVSFFMIVTILMSATAGRGIDMVFGLVLLLGGFGIFFERASGGNLYSGASIITSEDDSDGLISKIAEKAILASFVISPLLGVYIATEILGF